MDSQKIFSPLSMAGVKLGFSSYRLIDWMCYCDLSGVRVVCKRG
jgi:hypothetical protein